MHSLPYQVDKGAFDGRLKQALEACRKILEGTRTMKCPSDVEHSYDDKFTLAQWSIKTGVWVIFLALQTLGLTDDIVDKLLLFRAGGAGRSITMKFKSVFCVVYNGKKDKEVTGPVKHVISEPSGTTWTKSVKTTIDQHEWRLRHDWKLFVFPGDAEESEETILGEQSNSCIITTGSDAPPPYPKDLTREISLDWFLERLIHLQSVPSMRGAFHQVEFAIDRSGRDCHTPRRNPDVAGALQALNDMHVFMMKINSGLSTALESQKSKKEDFSELIERIHRDISDDTTSFFRPVLAMFSFEDQGVDSETLVGPKIAKDHLSKFGGEMLRTQTQCINDYKDLLGRSKAMLGECADNNVLVTSDEWLFTEKNCEATAASALCIMMCRDVIFCIGEIEKMLERQVIAAIGKNVSLKDFQSLLAVHNEHLFLKAYRPRPLCYSIRRPNRSPEGSITLRDGTDTDIYAMTCHSTAQSPMYFDLSSSASVSFLGERFVHAAILHKFSDSPRHRVELAASARLFSSFILLVGNIVSTELFKPTAALIIKDKDDLCMPLNVETVPTKEEFLDAIKSLSPEQQEFCREYRALQLSSTLFGILVIQVKPQLERLLNIPDDSLTKEIELTQDLMKIFVTYQVPADLVAYNGPQDATLQEKLSCVKEYVSSIKKIIEGAKSDSINQVAQETLMDIMESGKSSMVEKISSCEQKMRAVAKHPTAHVAKRASGPADAAFEMENSVLYLSAETSGDHGVRKFEPENETGLNGTEVQWKGYCEDYNAFPKALDERGRQFNKDFSLHPAIITPALVWTKTEKATILSKPVCEMLDQEAQRAEKQRAFDLLDAITRSGALPCEHTELHIVCAVSHNFDEMLMNVLTRKNVNPVASSEWSSLLVGSTLHGLPVSQIVQPSKLQALRATCPPELLEEEPQIHGIENSADTN